MIVVVASAIRTLASVGIGRNRVRVIPKMREEIR